MSAEADAPLILTWKGIPAGASMNGEAALKATPFKILVLFINENHNTPQIIRLKKIRD